MESNVRDLLRQMTLSEKVALTTGKGLWATAEIPRVGIPSLRLHDGPHGVRRPREESIGIDGAYPATCFPTASAMAASWDVDLLREIGAAIGEEALAHDVQILLGPGVNIKRTPLCGRNFEYFSEDPVLSGDLGAAFVQGVQSQGVGTAVKHFAVNNQEYERFTISADVDQRTLRELYLYSFERVIRKGKPWSVMSAYNRVNSIPATEHTQLLRQILKGEWAFEGFVVSDWGAVTDRVRALLGGTDLEMPGTPAYNGQVSTYVRSGQVPEDVLDEAAGRILQVVQAAAAGRRTDATFDVDAHHASARAAAGQCLVLLKNEGGVLPLDPGGLGRVAVIGAIAKAPRYQGGGSSQVEATRVDIPYDELARLAGPQVQMTYAPGYREDDSTDEALLAEAAVAARGAEVAILFIGLAHETESIDRADLELPAAHNRLAEAVCAAQPNTVVVLSGGSAMTMPWVAAPRAILLSLLGGQAVGGAIADVLWGRVNPSGKLAETFPVKLEDTPAYLNYPGDEDHVRYGEGLFVGYRAYDRRHVAPLFAFGHGLSYTTFAYKAIRLSHEALTDRDTLTVTVTVQNTGRRAGREVVQLYVRDVESRLVRPEKELKGFAKVHLEPGETKEVELTLEGRDFAAYDSARRIWYVESGAFEILAGSASDRIHLRAQVRVESSQPVPTLTPWTPLKHAWAHPGSREILLNLAKRLPAGGMLADDWLLTFLSDMPLAKVFAMSGSEMPPEQMQALIDQMNQAMQPR